MAVSPFQIYASAVFHHHAPDALYREYVTAFDTGNIRRAHRLVTAFLRLWKTVRGQKHAKSPSIPETPRPKVGDVVFILATGRMARLIAVRGEMAVVKDQFGSYYVPYAVVHKVR